ncbi:hypothetical protein PHET_00668 [Paragonimus heterotremus]|uniref:C2H2-type domain-containing protein n=1 Tax=Paragonimus heterotremus TaxID=100268 RepID=A0A8J4WLW2_9TREM|nr:hypothetical protein PHET_00668 [Paragonimus heterotremus]
MNPEQDSSVYLSLFASLSSHHISVLACGILKDALNTVSQDTNNPPQLGQEAQTQQSDENNQMDSAMSTMLLPNIYLAQKYLEMGSKQHDTMLLSTGGTVHPTVHPYGLIGWDSVDGAMDVRSLVRLHSAQTSGWSVQPYSKATSPSNPIGFSLPFGDSGCMSLTEDYSLVGGGRRSTSTPLTVFDSSGLPTAGTMPTISPTNCDSLERFHEPFHSDAALLSTSPPRSTAPQTSATDYRCKWYQTEGDSPLPTQPTDMRIPSLANVKSGEHDVAYPDGSHSDSELNLSSESVRRKNREDIKAFTTNGNLSRHVRTSHQLKIEAPSLEQEDRQKTEYPWVSDVNRPPNMTALDNAIFPSSFQTPLNLEINKSSNSNLNVGVGLNDELINYSTTLPSSYGNIPGVNTMSVSTSWLSIAHPRMSCISLLESASSQPMPSHSQLLDPSPRPSTTVNPLVPFGPTDRNSAQPRALSEIPIHKNRLVKQSDTIISLPAVQDINQPFEFMTSLRLQTTNWLQWLAKPHQHPSVANGMLVDCPGNANDPMSIHANGLSEFTWFSRPNLRQTPSLDGQVGPMIPNTEREIRRGADVQTVPGDSEKMQTLDKFVPVWAPVVNACNLSDNAVHSANLPKMEEQKRFRPCPSKRFGRHWSNRWKCAQSVKVFRRCRPLVLLLVHHSDGESSVCEAVVLSGASRMGQTAEAAADPLKISQFSTNSNMNFVNSSTEPNEGKTQAANEVVITDEDTVWDLSMPRHVKTETQCEMSIDNQLQLDRYATNNEVRVPPFELFDRIQLTTYVSVKDQKLGSNLPAQLSNTPINLSVAGPVNQFPLMNKETSPPLGLPLGEYGLHNSSKVRYLSEQNIATPSRSTDFKQKTTSINPIAAVHIPFVHKKNSYKDAPKLITCPIPGCNQKFPWNSSLKRHILTHTPHKPFACTRCTKSFSTKSNRERHMERVHQVSLKRQRQRIQCQITGAFSTSLLNGEQRSDGTVLRSGGNPSEPGLSDSTSLVNRTSHRGHWNCVSRKGRRQHSSQLATKPLVENMTPLSDKNVSLMYHEMKPEPIDQFEPPMDLTLRNSSTPTQPTIRCPICYAEVASRSFRRHVSLHQSDNPVFRCHLCQLSFRDRITTLRHWCSSHKDEWARFAYKFGLCHDTPIETLITTLNQSASDSGTSSESLDSTPSTSNSPASKPGLTGDMRYVSCCICLHRFGSHQDLQRHMRSHTGERPFVCPDCGKEFSLKHSMHRHYRVHVKQINQPPVSSTFSLIQQSTTQTHFSAE